jgi:autotransporter-associated beta strand protein
VLAFAIIAAISLNTAAHADTYYWDLNGSAANTVVAATGAWNGSNVFWNTDSTGGAGGTTTATVGNADDLVLFSGTSYTTGTITASGTRAASSITFEDNVALTLAGAVTIGGTGAKDGIFVATGNNANNIVSGTVTLNGNNTIQKDGTGTLTLSATSTLLGTGNLDIKNNNTGAISFSSTTASAFNFTGSITNSGTGAGGVNIGGLSTGNALITSSVTGITQNSSTSALTIFGTNAFTGGVTVNAGTANIVNSGASGGATGSILLGAESGTEAASIFMGSGTTNATPITVRTGSSGVKTIGSVFAAGGTGTTMTWSGNITANDDVTVLANGNPTIGLVLSGSSISIAAGKTMTLNNAQGTASKLNISGSLSGTSTSKVVLTTGGARLSGNNSSFAGEIIQQSASPLELTNSDAGGTGKIVLKSTITGTGTTLGISGGITVATAIEMDSTTGRENIISTGTGNNSLTGGMTITGAGGNALVISNSQTSGNLTVSGGISGASYTGSVSLRGSLAGAKGFLNGVVTLASDLQNNGTTDWTVNAVGSSYNGTRFISSGNFILGATNGLATNAQVYWTNTATGKVDMNGFNQSVAGLNTSLSTPNATHGVTNNGASDSTLTLAAMAADLTFAGAITDGSTNKVALEMNSAGRIQTLSGISTYTGDTLVNNGTLVLSSTGGLNFKIGSDGVNNQITGAGTVSLDGRFTFDLTTAATALNNSWNIVTVATLIESFGSNFDVDTFSRTGGGTGAGIWTKAIDPSSSYEFNTSSGVLSVIPEPSAALLGGLSVLLLLRRRRA